MDALAVALIRSLNGHVISIMDSDQDVYDMFGRAAQPLADGIRQAIREEIKRELSALGVSFTP
jgi:hypothetical protein